MAKITLEGAQIADSTVSNHIAYTKREQTGTGGGQCTAWDEYGMCIAYAPTYPIYDDIEYKTSAIVKGTAKSTVTNVSIEGKAPIINGDKTQENDNYTIPSGGTYKSGAHTNAQGSITSGNSNNVYCNGKLIAIEGSTVKTHANTNTTIKGTSSTVTIGG